MATAVAQKPQLRAEARPAVSWHPFKVSGTALPPQLLLVAKLIVLAFVVKRVEPLSDVYLPFIPALDDIGHPVAFYRVSQVVLVGAGLAILLNRFVRTACFTMGAVIFLALLASRPFNRDAILFCSFFLLLIGMYMPRYGMWPLRLQVIIVYFGAALNKLLQPDWRSGQFFEHWMIHTYSKHWYALAVSYAPPLLLSKLMSWMVMCMESFLSIGFFLPRLYPIAIWVGMLLHSGMLLFVNETFKVFFYAILASYLVFIRWPQRLTVIYDHDCGFCSRMRDFFRRFDLEQRYEWVPLQQVEDPGLPGRAQLSRALHLVADSKVYSGFRALKMILLYNPLTYFGLLILLAAPQPAGFYYRRWLVLALLVVFSPFFEPVGERLYRAVARNRRWISATCVLPRQA